MARITGQLYFASNLEMGFDQPLDSRIAVPKKSNLTSYAAPYDGMVVSVYDDGEDNGIYFLALKSDVADLSKWEKIGSGTSVTVDATLSNTSTNPLQNNTIHSALDEKVDKETGKGLSSNDFTNAYKQQLDDDEPVEVDSTLSSTSTNPLQNNTIHSALDEKVDKETGKGLSSNDFTNAYKTQLDNGGGSSYSLPLASNGTRGGIQLGYPTDTATSSYGVLLDSEKAYVFLPDMLKKDQSGAIQSNTSPQLVIEPSASTTGGVDAAILIRGKRSGSTASNNASVVFRNHDSQLATDADGGNHNLGAIIGKVSNHEDNLGDMLFQTSSNGTNLVTTMKLKSTGETELTADVSIGGDLDVTGEIKGDAVISSFDASGNSNTNKLPTVAAVRSHVGTINAHIDYLYDNIGTPGHITANIDTTPSAGVHLGMHNTAAVMELSGSDNTSSSYIDFTYNNQNTRGRIRYIHASHSTIDDRENMIFSTAINQERLRLNSDEAKFSVPTIIEDGSKQLKTAINTPQIVACGKILSNTSATQVVYGMTVTRTSTGNFTGEFVQDRGHDGYLIFIQVIESLTNRDDIIGVVGSATSDVANKTFKYVISEQDNSGTAGVARNRDHFVQVIDSNMFSPDGMPDGGSQQ